MVLLHYNRTAVGWSAFVHHRTSLMMRSTSAHIGAIVDGTAFVTQGLTFVHAGALVNGAAFVTQGLAFVHAGTLVDGAAFVLRCVLVHHRALMSGCVPMDGRTLVTGVPLHGAALLSGRPLLHRRSGLMVGIASLHGTALLSGRALLHRWSGLLAGAAFRYRPVLLCLCRPLAAGLTGRRRFGNSHDERGAEETCHQCDCQYFL